MTIATLLLPFNLTVNVKTLKRLRKEGQLCYDETTPEGAKILFLPTVVSDDQCCDDCTLLLQGPVLWNDDEEVTRKPK